MFVYFHDLSTLTHSLPINCKVARFSWINCFADRFNKTPVIWTDVQILTNF